MNPDQKVKQVRSQMHQINYLLKKGEFKVPVHLAFGHEALAVAVDAVMKPEDILICSHRNIHYNLARDANLDDIIREFKAGRYGSMNLAMGQGIMYSSSILGNNLSVACGVAWAKKFKGESGVVFVVTGDGALEEGAFYEALEFIQSQHLRVIVIVENNGWSLATRINERRCDISLSLLAYAFCMDYLFLPVGDVNSYINLLTIIKDDAVFAHSYLVEVKLETEGGRTTDHFINYHAGVANMEEQK